MQDATRGLACDHVTTKVMRGDAARALRAEAEAVGANAIVVGNRRTQGVGRVLGSVAASVVKHAPCDVVVANTCHQHQSGSVAEATTAEAGAAV